MRSTMTARILVAEDDPAVRQFVSRALVQHGHTVDTVNGGLEALDALGFLHRQPGLVQAEFASGIGQNHQVIERGISLAFDLSIFPELFL